MDARSLRTDISNKSYNPDGVTTPKPKPLVLIVLDGFGVGPKTESNAIFCANTPFYDSLLRVYPNTTLQASGEPVGIPNGMAGNSEVGHMNLGAGTVVLQEVMRINRAIESGEFFSNPALIKLADHTKKNDSSLHIVGLLSRAIVHSAFDHLLALIKFAKDAGVKQTYIHVQTDGRDSPPDDAINMLAQLTDYMNKVEYGHIASIVGRYFGMDRDRRWDRTQKAYELMTLGNGRAESDPIEGVKNAYTLGETDEFISPISIVLEGRPPITVADNDGMLFFNFRTDRPRQLSHAFLDENFDGFERVKRPANLNYTTMTRYEDDLSVSGVCFDPPNVPYPFPAVISDYGLHQVRIAESEKRAHVTYFFNGGREKPFPLEDRIICDSPKIATYDLRPEMSEHPVTEYLLSSVNSGTYDFILVNYANPDMVAHTGNMEATIAAIESIDHELSKVIPRIIEAGGAAILTSDHGNSERLINPETHGMDTEHNVFPVPFVYMDKFKRFRIKALEERKLADVAPTMLFVLGIEIPEEMTGNVLLEESR